MPLRYLYLRGQEPTDDVVSLKGPYNSQCEISAQGMGDELDLDWDNWMKWDAGTTAMQTPGEQPRDSKTDILCSPVTYFSDFEFAGKDEASPSSSAGNFEDAPFDLDEVNNDLLFSPTSSTTFLPGGESRHSFDLGSGQVPTVEGDEGLLAMGPEDSAVKANTIPNTNLARPKPSRPLRINTSARRGKKRKVPEDDQEPTDESKKRGHNAIEKRYRTNLNEKISCLRDAIPISCKTSLDTKNRDEDSEEEDIDSKSGQQKFGKAAVLTRALEYIKHLEQTTQRLGKEMDTLKIRIGAFESLARSGTTAAEQCEMSQSSTPSTLESIRDGMYSMLQHCQALYSQKAEFNQMKTQPRSRSRSTPDPAPPRKRGRRPGKSC